MSSLWLTSTVVHSPMSYSFDRKTLTWTSNPSIAVLSNLSMSTCTPVPSDCLTVGHCSSKALPLMFQLIYELMIPLSFHSQLSAHKSLRPFLTPLLYDSPTPCQQKSQAREVEQLAQVMEEAAMSSGGWSGSLDWIAPAAGQPAPMELLDGCWRLLYTSGFNNGGRDGCDECFPALSNTWGSAAHWGSLLQCCVSNVCVSGRNGLHCTMHDPYLG